MRTPTLELAALVVVGVMLFRPRKAMAYAGGKQIGLIELKSIGGGFELRSDVADAFEAMRAAAASDGVRLVVNSAFRSNERQTQLYTSMVDGAVAVARPGWSTHQQGTTVDIEVGNSTSSVTYLWLARYAATYGFRNTGSAFGEPWHWEHSA